MLTILELKKEVGHLNFKLDGMIKYLRVLNSRTKILKEILGVRNSSKDMKVMEYTRES